MKKNTTAGKAFLARTVHSEHCSSSSLFPCFLTLQLFVTIFGFSPFYPCCNQLSLDCMVFHLVCKAI